MATMIQGLRPIPGDGWGLWGRISRWIVATPWTLWTIVAINLGAAIPGYIFWYGDDIADAPSYLLPFIPDSPLSVTLMGFALIVLHRGGRAPLLGLLACTGAIKYGLWTDFVWFQDWLQGGSYSFQAVHLSLSHFGMVLEGLVVLPLLAPRLMEIVVVQLWYGANDVVDYVLGYHPRGPDPGDIDMIARFSVATTIVLGAAWLVLWTFRWLHPWGERRI